MTPTPTQAGNEQREALSYRDPLGQTRAIRTSEEMRKAWDDITEHSRVWSSAKRFLHRIGLTDADGAPILAALRPLPATDAAERAGLPREAVDPAEVWREAYVAVYGCEPTHPKEMYQRAYDVIAEALTPPATRAEPSEEDAREREVIERAIRATEYKYFGDYELSDDQREAVDQLALTAQHYLDRFAQQTASGQGETSAGLVELAAKHAECAFDDRPRNRVGHPSLIDWEDGYREGTQAAAQAIRAALASGASSND